MENVVGVPRTIVCETLGPSPPAPQIDERPADEYRSYDSSAPRVALRMRCEYKSEIVTVCVRAQTTTKLARPSCGSFGL